MTYTTKRQLRISLTESESAREALLERAEKNAERARKAESRFSRANSTLMALGYQVEYKGERDAFGDLSPYPIWRRTKAQEIRDQGNQDAADKFLREQAERETLTLVINALELKQYLYGTIPHTDHFREDLKTALRVRAEEKQAEADRKTVEKVAGLLGVAKKDTFDFATTVGMFNDTLSTTYSDEPPAGMYDRIIDAIHEQESAKGGKKGGKK